MGSYCATAHAPFKDNTWGPTLGKEYSKAGEGG